MHNFGNHFFFSKVLTELIKYFQDRESGFTISFEERFSFDLINLKRMVRFTTLKDLFYLDIKI